MEEEEKVEVKTEAEIVVQIDPLSRQSSNAIITDLETTIMGMMMRLLVRPQPRFHIEFSSSSINQNTELVAC